MADDVLDYVRKFLGRSGYPLEMKVARSLRHRGFMVDQASTYVDAKTGALREVDVIARARKSMPSYRAPGWIELRLVIECKHTDKPWLLFIGDGRFTKSREHLDCLDIVGPNTAALVEARSADDMPVISHAGDIAYSVKVVGERDDAFAAVQQVNSAVVGVQRDLTAPDQSDWLEPTLVALVPVVVIDSPLIECRLDTQNALVLNPVDKGLLVSRLRPEDRLHSVWIVTDSGLEDFAKLAQTTVDNMSLGT